MKWLTILVALVGIGLCASVRGVDNAPAADPFAGKILMIFLSQTPDSTAYALTDVQRQSLFGKEFIVGVGADSHADHDWVKGKKFRIPLEHVTTIAEFTPAEYDKFCADNKPVVAP